MAFSIRTPAFFFYHRLQQPVKRLRAERLGHALQLFTDGQLVRAALLALTTADAVPRPCRLRLVARSGPVLSLIHI